MSKPKTTLRFKMVRNVSCVHLELENGRTVFPVGGVPIRRFYTEMTPLGECTKTEFDFDKVYTIELLPEHPETPENVDDPDLAKALKDAAIQKALDNRAKNSEARLWVDRYVAAKTIELVD